MTPPGPERTEPKTIGRYQVEEEIGRGGMAVVYRGRQPSLNRLVAIKVLPEQFSGDEELIRRFQRESEAIAALSHPNIIQIIDRGREGGRYYFVMEYVDGPSLDALLARGPLPVAAALETAVQVARALEYAHRRGVVHRDLKPSNILLSRDLKVAKLADFGIVRVLRPEDAASTLTQAGRSLGTVNYMSPEQRCGAERIDGRSDIFSLGVALYQMLTGRLPLGNFRLPSHLNRRLPPSLDRIVLKCLAADPEGRYPDAAALLKDLETEKLKLIDFRGQAASLLQSVRMGFVRATARLPAGKRWLFPALAAAALAAVLLIFSFGRVFRTSRVMEAVRTAAPFSPGLKSRLDAAERQLERGSAEAAIRELEGVVRDHPAGDIGAASRLRMAKIREKLERYPEALADYLLAAESFPRSPQAAEALCAAGRIYSERLKQPAEAVRCYERTAGDYPGSDFAAPALYSLGRLYRVAGKDFFGRIFGTEKQSSLEASARALERLVTDYPDSPEAEAALWELAELYGEDGLDDPARSNEYCRKLLKRNPKTARPVHFRMGENFEALGDNAAARDSFQRYLKLDPGGARAAEAWRKLGRLK